MEHLLTDVGGSLFPGPGFGSDTAISPLGAALRKESCVCVKFVLELSYPCPVSTKGPLTSPGGALFRWLGLMWEKCQKPELVDGPGDCPSKNLL